MVDQKLVDYVKNVLKQGQSVDSVKQTLINQGWSAADVDEAIASVQPAAQPEAAAPTAAQAGVGIFGKFKLALRSPGQLFEAVKPEHDLNSAVKYYAIMSLIPFLIAIIITLASPTFLASMSSVFAIFTGPLSTLFALFIIVGVMAVVAFYFIGIVLSFSSAGLFHIFAMMLRAEKNGFAQTYKSFSYALPPEIIGSIVVMLMVLAVPTQTIVIAIITLFFVAWHLLVSIIGLSHLHGVTKKRAALVVIVPIVIVIVVILLIQYVILPAFIEGLMGELMGGLGGLSV